MTNEASSISKDIIKNNIIRKKYDVIHIFLAILIVVFMSIAAFFWFNSEMIATFFNYDYLYSDTSERRKFEMLNSVRIMAGFLMLFSTCFISYLYLVGFNPINYRKNTINKNQNHSMSNEEHQTIVTLIASIAELFEKEKQNNILSDNELNEVILGVGATIEKQLNNNLLSQIEDKYGITIKNNQLSNKAEDLLNSTIERLERYSSDLKRKASVNLAYGIGATIGAICILLFVIMNIQTPNTTTNIEIVFYYTSRLFLVLLVQGISIFFLNLYKSTLNNILYINNEITNHESKRDALILSLVYSDEDSYSKVLTTLSNTERNFVLKKGETSIYDKGSQPLENPISASVVTDLLKKLVTKDT